MRLNHVTLIVGELQRSLRFYRLALNISRHTGSCARYAYEL